MFIQGVFFFPLILTSRELTVKSTRKRLITELLSYTVHSMGLVQPKNALIVSQLANYCL